MDDIYYITFFEKCKYYFKKSVKNFIFRKWGVPRRKAVLLP